jgi:hypothetical protein
MISAIVDGIRRFATPGTTGICPYCGTEVRSKCGELNAWHFAHFSVCECDYWKEHESEWHLKWKSWFPVDNTEVIKTINGEKHIADVHIGTTTLELQASPIKIQDRREREQFWGIGMRWIVKSNFDHFTLTSFDKHEKKNPRTGKQYRKTLDEIPSYTLFFSSRDGVGYPVMWKWRHPKRWITTDPPFTFFIDLTGSNYILKVTKVIENNFGFGNLLDRVEFIKSLKGCMPVVNVEGEPCTLDITDFHKGKTPSLRSAA